jgi:hypothetical protein
LHGYLIGNHGARIQDFELRYHVKVSFDSALNQAIVQGTEERVDQAAEELRQTVELDKGWAPLICQLTVTNRAARRLAIEKRNIIQTTNLEALNINDSHESDGRPVVVLRAKDVEILNKAEAIIRQICYDVQAESELKLEIPLDLRGLIRKTWTDIVLRCGGPEDRNLQRELIDL